MNKKANILFLSLLVFLSFELYARTPPPAVQSACHAIWSIKSNFSNYRMEGTGFFISPNLFITNLHVIEKALLENRMAYVYLKQNSYLKTIKGVVGFSINPDLVILETETESDTYLSLRTDPLDEKEKLFVPGYPETEFHILNTMGSIKEELNELSVLLDGYNLQGASGSPLLDSKARVAGVLYYGGKNMGRFISGDKLKKFIEENQNKICEKPKSKKCLKKLVQSFLKKIEKQEIDTSDLFTLSDILKKGMLGFGKDTKSAHEWLERAYQRNDYIPAKFEMAMKLYYEKDWAKAREILVELAREGHTEAQLYLAMMLVHGLGGTKDLVKAREMLDELATKYKHPSALFYKAKIDYHGYGEVEKNYTTAFKIFSELVYKHKHIEAQLYVAMMLFNGDGVKQDINQALTILKELSDKGHAKAQYYLKKMLDQGIQQNPQNTNEVSKPLYELEEDISVQVFSYQDKD